ncbi:PHP domain-containing protein [Lachnotalea glycerini]|uniref:PHP domain-containing protein n=1 Tax=Lachnotalea glycerini TaxID=1763509 RepID=A0A371JKC0_9FIRM|nr:PHP domain-containing protein [Lachnotalea glycerini]RDY33160.1 PHP domain-containing protein [Lachnotalea glycerini]
MNTIDLHVHSNASDGTYSPTQLVDYASKKHLSAFALTDHDTVAGVNEAIHAATQYNIKVIPGVELSTDYNNQDVHILGLFIDYTNDSFLSKLKDLNAIRAKRNDQMCYLLQKEGFDISIKKMYEKFGDTVITRAHFARYLLDHGYLSSMKEAFDSYLDVGCSCYVPKYKCSPFEAIDIILKANGVPVLAHPLLYRFNNKQLEELVHLLKNSGLMGIEAIYSLNENQDEANMLALARKYNLKVTGGSDFHGKNKPNIDLGIGRGSLLIPASLLEQFAFS